MVTDQPLTIVIDGQEASLGMDTQEPLVRAVLISLFTWRRAQPDDHVEGSSRQGWWGDSFPSVENDKIGSRLWILSRAKFTAQHSPVDFARECGEEALAWMVEDGVVARVEVETQRQGKDALYMACRFYKADGSLQADIRFADLWSFLK